MTESTPASILDGLTFEAVEWLPSGAESGLLRVRGRWSPGMARPEGLPALCAAVGDGVSRYESLPDAQAGNGGVWRGAYLLPEAIARSGVWLEWESGERSALPVPAGLDERAAPSRPVGAEDEEAGGELIDRSVLAERRARRAEAAEQAQARVASEALRALDALERRGTELEARVEELVAERDALAARAEELERRTPRDEHQRAALAAALSAAAEARRRARDLQLHMRTSEIARTSDAVRLRVLESGQASAETLRAERAEVEAELASARSRAEALESEAARAREQAVAAAAGLDDARRDFATRLDERTAELDAARAELASHEAQLGAARSELEAVRGELASARAELSDTRAAAADEARAAAAGLSEAREAAAAQLAEAQEAAEAQLAEAQTAADAQLAEAQAAADAQLADLRAAAEDQARAAAAELAEARAAAEALRTSLDEERTARATAGAEAETARAEATAATADLRAERVARGSLEAELERERAARSALGDALDAETAALASLHTELNEERRARTAAEERLAEVGALQGELERERAAREADQSALAALRDDLATERAALAEVRQELESLRSTRDDLAAQLRAEMEAAREADRAVLAALRADLNAERAAREADQRELAALRTRLSEAQAEAGRTEGGLLDRVAELDRRAAGLADELELQRRAREQAEAAAGAARSSSEEDSGRMVADLDAAASALRERATNGTTEAPPAPEVAPPDEAVAEVVEDRAEADAAITPAATPPERERREIVSASSGPSRAHATGRSQRQYPWLRGALVKLAHDDPKAAGRLIAALLPVQAVIVQGPVDYDLTIAEVGTFAVTVASGRAYVKEIAHPRGRRQAEFHLWAEALTLAELIAGVPHRIGRFRGPIKISGRKRRYKPLRVIPEATISLAEAARAGARLEPGLVFRTFPYVIHAAWSRGHRFTIAQSVAEDTWYISVGNGQGIRVSSTPPEEPTDAVVTMTAEGFGHLLRGEPAPRGHRPVVRGDRDAVATLKAWIDRAQGA